MKNNANLWTPNDELEVEFKTKYILIRNSSNTKVLAVRNEPDLVEEDFEEGKDEQLWTREDSNTDGFFTLKNLKVQKYLTAVSENTLQVRGKYSRVQNNRTPSFINFWNFFQGLWSYYLKDLKFTT